MVVEDLEIEQKQLKSESDICAVAKQLIEEAKEEARNRLREVDLSTQKDAESKANKEDKKNKQGTTQA